MPYANSVSHSNRPGLTRLDARVERWIAGQLAKSPPKAKSLIVTVWGDAIAPHGGAVWLSGLFPLLAPFGISERLVRTSVYRLVQEGWLEVKPSGRQSLYRLTAEGERRFEAAYSRIYATAADTWDGAWDLVIVAAGTLTASVRKDLQRELGWYGFGSIGANLLLRPSRRDRQDALGVIEALGASNGVAFLAGKDRVPATASLRSQVDSAWDLKRVAHDHRVFVKRFSALIAAFPDRDHSPQHAFVVRTLLMHDFRRVMLHDPQLPSELLPARWPGTAAYALCRDFYRRTHRQAEAHLFATLRSEHGALPPAADYFYRRFGGLD